MSDIDDGYPWGPEGPPAEAYSRVTRDLGTLYAPLAGAGQDAVRRLAVEYDVIAQDVPHSERTRFERIVEAIALVPRDGSTPTVTIGWTDLPGLTVRLGEDGTAAVPPCGCDACAESLEQCLDMFATELEQVEREWNGIRR